MALNSTFQPQGPTVLIGVSALQVPIGTTGGGGAVTYRVRCLITAYLTWGNASVAAVGGPGANTLGMTAGGIETFTFPAQCFFISNVGASFEVTPGEGE